MPNFSGGWKDYWGGSFYWEGVLFISVTAFLLALFALGASRHPQKKIFAGMGLFSSVPRASGGPPPLFEFSLSRHFPLFGNFRGVGKLNVLMTMCLLALAAMGMEEIFRKGPLPRS